MSKKKLKKALRRALEQNAAANAYGTYGAYGAESAAAYAPGTEGAAQTPLNAGFLSGLGLPAGFGSRQTEQFLLGALLGAAATYVLSDEALRAKIVKGAMKLYAGVAGGFEEIKEQMADLKAEAEAERAGDA
ncbi:MAG: hypothetical protein REI09_01890 [Candidatus Dactylopiibacterium sp.]|nr:hypothetical protein [Candidatus Dactylopiibacterium sp.]